jgi:predicted metalloprotease with PDZ domain
MYKNIFSKKLALFILGGVLAKRVTSNYFKFINTDYFNENMNKSLAEAAKMDKKAKLSFFSRYLLSSIKKHILLGSGTLFFLLNIFKEKNIITCETKKPYLGCSIRAKDDGMQIILIKSESPAERAGLLVKDIILEIDGKKVTSINEFNSAIGLNLDTKAFKIKRKVNDRDVIFTIDINLVYNE